VQMPCNKLAAPSFNQQIVGISIGASVEKSGLEWYTLELQTL
jgi:hypothetical protein